MEDSENTDEDTGFDDSTVSESNIPDSYLDLQCSKFSIWTEIPYVNGSKQKVNITMKKSVIESKGIVNMPLIKSDTANLTKEINHPEVWNDELYSETNLQFSKAEIFYMPDFMRIINDISSTVHNESIKSPSVIHFIPSRERINVRVKDKYCLNLGCSRDNAWRDLLNGLGDDYGRLILKGENGELNISPSNATQFNADSSVSYTHLTLPTTSRV